MHTRPHVKQVSFYYLYFLVYKIVSCIRMIPKIMTHLYTCGRGNENEAHLPVFSFILLNRQNAVKMPRNGLTMNECCYNQGL
jgi:tRNA U38,U39,U40 pseudouridine synthase TruA